MIKLYDFDKLSPAEIFARTDDSADVAEAVRGIIEAVKAEGDKALFRFAKQAGGGSDGHRRAQVRHGGFLRFFGVYVFAHGFFGQHGHNGFHNANNGV